jgi:putative membrane protein
MARLSRRTAAVGMLAALVAAPSAAPALAQGEASEITHRQSILTELSPTGDAGASRVFTQLGVVGDGDVEVVLPDQATRGLRNIGGIGRPQTDGDAVVWSVDATQEGALKRTVANNTAALPVSIDISYSLDGETVDPSDIVGRSGELTVTYDVRNLTSEPTEVQISDGEGNRTTETIDVAVPMVGTLSMSLDDRFVDVEAPGAAIAGDGRGSTVVNWSLLLFAPLGEERQTVSWTAQVNDAIVPEASASILPVDSDSFASLDSTKEAYAGAVASTIGLSTRAGQLDSSMQRLARGAGQLLEGLVQLRDGTGELAAGLNDSAVPGSRELADGMGQARAGAGELADGLGTRAAPGSRELADGTGQARAGAGQLASGLIDLLDGAGRLAAGTGDASSGALQLGSGLIELRNGTAQLSDGLTAARSGGRDLTAGLRQLSSGAGDLSAGLGSALDGSETIRDGIGGLGRGIGGPDDGAEDGTVIGGVNALREGIAGLPESAEQSLSVALTDALNDLVRPPLVAGVESGIEQTLGATLQNRVQPGIVEGLRDRAAAGLAAGLQGQLFPQMEGSVDRANPANSSGLAGFLFQQVTFDGDPANFLAAADQAEALAGAYFDAVVAQGAHTAFGTNAADTLADGLDDSLEVAFDDLATQYAAGFARGIGVEGSDGFDGSLREAFNTFGPQFAAGYREGLEVALAEEALPGFDRLLAGLDNPACDRTKPTDPANPCGIRQVLQLLGAGSSDLADGLDQLDAGGSQLAAGARAAREGSSQLANGLVLLDEGGIALRAGTRQAAAGGGDLAAGLAQIDGGANQLADGAGRAATGGRDLASGLGQIDDGANELASGLGDAATGSRELATGMGLLDDGANQLADGLVDAGDGSQQIADGMEQAADGGEQVADGTEQFREQGTKALAEGVSEATMDPSRLLEHAKAADERGKAGDGLAYGTVDGADASAVYQFEIAGVGADEGPSTPVKAAGALLGFGALGAMGLGMRRRLV